VTVAGVYRQLYRHCSESLEHMAPVDRAVLARARETVHIYGGTHREREANQSGRTRTEVFKSVQGMLIRYLTEHNFLHAHHSSSSVLSLVI
jgi:hypothetical protein